MKYPTKDALKLMLDGAIALAQASSHGMRIDVPRLERTTADAIAKIAELEQRLYDDPYWRKTWQRLHGNKSKLGNRQQLCAVLKEKGFEFDEETATGQDAMDKKVLAHIDLEFVRNYERWEQYRRLYGTYLKGIKRELVGELIHPVFNLHTVITYRSSAKDINVQNLWNRNPEMAKLLRECFIPRPGNVILEIDCAAHEWRIAACKWRDPNMIKYVKSGKDVHGEMAAQCYCTPVDDVSKEMRSVGKNGFVFPRLYGSYYISIAQAMWLAIAENNLKTKSGVPVMTMLRRAGITELGELDPRADTEEGTFVHHLRLVEKEFLGMFPVFAKKSEEWYQRYREVGGFPLMTGFWVGGLMSKNNCLNSDIQGSAFHCLLWGFIRCMKQLYKRQLDALLVAEVHDCMVYDCPVDEVQEVIDMTIDVMTVQLPQAWDWICVPLAMEPEMAETNWWAKKPMVQKNGLWVLK